jgi:hypothetical protein
MPQESEKARRKEIVRSHREARRKSIRDGLPVPSELLRLLFNHVDARLEEDECDHSLRFTREFIHDQQLPEEKVLSWLREAGGYCDCEVIGNAEEILDEATA